MNELAQPLTLHEIGLIKASPAAQARLVKSYAMFLDFMGFSLADPATGRLAKTGDFEARIRNINLSGHNFLRITRITKCLGELGLEHFIEPFLGALIDAVFVSKRLDRAEGSIGDYWIPVVRDDQVRGRLAARVASLLPPPGDRERPGHDKLGASAHAWPDEPDLDACD